MTKTTTNLLLMLITILAGIYFYVTYCSSCGTTAVKEEVVTPEATSYPFAFSDGTYVYNENDNYNFNVSSSSILTPLSQKVTDGITSLRTFLTENAAKVINMTGYYKSDENNNTAYPNLGLARANAVKNYLVENGISSAQINTMGKLIGNIVPKDNVYLGPITSGFANRAIDAENELKTLYAKTKANRLVLYFDAPEASIHPTDAQGQKVADLSRYLDKEEESKAIIDGYTITQVMQLLILPSVKIEQILPKNTS